MKQTTKRPTGSRKETEGREIKDSRFPFSIFWIFLGACMLIAGGNVGLIMLMDYLNWLDIIQVHIILVYWIIIAAILTLHVRKRVEVNYDIPMRKVSEATKKVAKGDFSVYIQPTHTPDQADYLDLMITDLNLMIEELGSIETLKTDFISNVSHEMKTPIAVIKNAVQMLQMEKLSPEERMEYAKAAERAAGRLSDLITNILKLNKLEHQKILPQLESYDVCRQLCDCVLQFENKWNEKEIEPELALEDEALILADPSLMELVWNNLLSNAIKFTDAGGRLIIRQWTERDQVIISVADTGCGMDEETLRHIFDKFYQGDTSHATEGNGLGLSLVYRVLQLMDGDIRAESKRGEGSCFTVTLPVPEMTKERTEEGGVDEI